MEFHPTTKVCYSTKLQDLVGLCSVCKSYRTVDYFQHEKQKNRSCNVCKARSKLSYQKTKEELGGMTTCQCGAILNALTLLKHLETKRHEQLMKYQESKKIK
jgi:hypothetical protein